MVRESPRKKLFTLLSNHIVSVMDRAKMTEHTFMIIVAVLIGVLAGFAAIGIRALIREISFLSFPGPGVLLDNIFSAPWHLKVLIPVIGGLIVGPIIYFLAPEAKGHGVPEVMQAILLKGGKIRPRVAFVKAITSAVTIGTGGSVGREGPIVQVGSGLGSTIGQFFKVPAKRMNTLVGCGAAAGIAAAFNAPIAGALFAVEIILMDFSIAQFSPIVISSVMATVVSHRFEGNFAAFQVPNYQLVSPGELGLYLVLGVASGLVSFVFIKVLYYSEDFFDNRFKFPEYLKPMVGGLGIGITALLFPQIMGVGYDSIDEALHGNMIWYLALALIFVKIFATSLTLGSGGSGGIFSPSLFMGAMLGVFFGSFAHELFPYSTATPGAYALVAMGGLVAGTTRAPLTAIIVVFELTDDYHIILPLMITCIISTILSSKLSRESIYTLKLLLRNINIKEGTETNIMESIFVNEVYTDTIDSINMKDDLGKVINRVLNGKANEFPVVDGRGRIKGIISMNEIKDLVFEKDALQDLLIAGDIARTNFETVTPADNCQTALDKMSKYDLDGIPVVDPSHRSKLIGMIWLKDIQDGYQKEIQRREVTSSLASSITMGEREKHVRFLEGYSVAEVAAPKSFTGKSIRQLDIGAKYGVNVLSIKSKKGKEGSKIKAIPSPESVIKTDDILVIAGETKNINLLKNLE